MCVPVSMCRVGGVCVQAHWSILLSMALIGALGFVSGLELGGVCVLVIATHVALWLRELSQVAVLRRLAPSVPLNVVLYVAGTATHVANVADEDTLESMFSSVRFSKTRVRAAGPAAVAVVAGGLALLSFALGDPLLKLAAWSGAIVVAVSMVPVSPLNGGDILIDVFSTYLDPAAACYTAYGIGLVVVAGAVVVEVTLLDIPTIVSLCGYCLGFVACGILVFRLIMLQDLARLDPTRRDIAIRKLGGIARPTPTLVNHVNWGWKSFASRSGLFHQDESHSTRWRNDGRSAYTHAVVRVRPGTSGSVRTHAFLVPAREHVQPRQRVDTTVQSLRASNRAPRRGSHTLQVDDGSSQLARGGWMEAAAAQSGSTSSDQQPDAVPRATQEGLPTASTLAASTDSAMPKLEQRQERLPRAYSRSQVSFKVKDRGLGAAVAGSTRHLAP